MWLATTAQVFACAILHHPAAGSACGLLPAVPAPPLQPAPKTYTLDIDRQMG